MKKLLVLSLLVACEAFADIGYDPSYAPANGTLDDTSTTAASEDAISPIRITPQRALHMNLRNQAGTEIGTSSNPVVTVNQAAAATNGIAFGDFTSAAIAVAPVRRTIYTEPASQAAFSIKSASASDAAAGTGAKTITILYLDAAGTAQLSETVTLNGTTCVNSLTTTAKFFERVIVETAGSTGSNVGILTLYTGTGCTTVVGTVAATDNRTFWAHHYVPDGKECNVTGLSVSHSGTTVGSGGVFFIRAKPLAITNSVDLQRGDSHRLYGQSSTTARLYSSPVSITGPSRVVVYVLPETATSTVYRASIDFFEP